MKNIDLVKHALNKNNIGVGNNIIVTIGDSYHAIVKGLKLDEKNRKIYAFLENAKKGMPSKVDVSDCAHVKNRDKI